MWRLFDRLRLHRSVMMRQLLQWRDEGGGGGHAFLTYECQPDASQVTSQSLLDQSQAGVHRGKRHIPPRFGPFWAYSRALPQGVELLG